MTLRKLLKNSIIKSAKPNSLIQPLKRSIVRTGQISGMQSANKMLQRTFSNKFFDDLSSPFKSPMDRINPFSPSCPLNPAYGYTSFFDPFRSVDPFNVLHEEKNDNDNHNDNVKFYSSGSWGSSNIVETGARPEYEPPRITKYCYFDKAKELWKTTSISDQDRNSRLMEAKNWIEQGIQAGYETPEVYMYLGQIMASLEEKEEDKIRVLISHCDLAIKACEYSPTYAPAKAYIMNERGVLVFMLSHLYKLNSDIRGKDIQKLAPLCFREALELDPQHWVAEQNLYVLNALKEGSSFALNSSCLSKFEYHKSTPLLGILLQSLSLRIAQDQEKIQTLSSRRWLSGANQLNATKETCRINSETLDNLKSLEVTWNAKQSQLATREQKPWVSENEGYVGAFRSNP